VNTISEERLQLAAEYIETHGWVQGTEKSDGGQVCLHGAIKFCAPADGDTEIIRAMMRREGYSESWNDADGRNVSDVLTALHAVSVTDEDLAATFGPQWDAVVTLARRAATLTAEESSRLATAWNAARAVAWVDARAAAGVAAVVAARTAAGDAVMDVARGAARDAAVVAAWALVIRDLIGQHGFTQEHYDTLTAPWATTIGAVHPDDELEGK